MTQRGSSGWRLTPYFLAKPIKMHPKNGRSTLKAAVPEVCSRGAVWGPSKRKPEDQVP